MKFHWSLLLFGCFLFLPVLASGHGGAEPDTTDEESDDAIFDMSLSLEQIYAITIIIALAMSGILFYLIGIKDQKLILTMVGIAIVLLTSDFLFFKYYVYS
ncbi:MAG: hypothetical protein ACW98K_02550 [Candidatus Kariarchaeaceae archaeon]|jgi:hypothetical protein